MTDRELDGLVAEKVMGCKPVLKGERWHCGCGSVCNYPYADGDRDSQLYGILSAYTTDAVADYSVLEKVRSEWDLSEQGQFGYALATVWDVRFDDNPSTLPLAAYYEVGDYARAALKALGVSTEEQS